MPYLIVRDRSGKVLSESELKDPLRVGRSPECGIRLRDPQASREHCEIRPWGDTWMLRDLGSHNGTTVNGKTAKEQVLHDGDRIEIGHHRITYSTAKSDTRIRARDPVAAGLADCETSIGPAIEEWTTGSTGESSLFATRVTPSLDDAPTSIATSRAAMLPPRTKPARSWRLVATVAAIALLATAAWFTWN